MAMIDPWSSVLGFWEDVVSTVSMVQPVDVLDILVVAYLLYQGIRLIRETRAMQLIKGIAAVIVLYFVALLANMNTLSFLIQNILSVGIVVIVIVFQPEVRRALEHVGRTTKLSSFTRYGVTEEEALLNMQNMIDTIGDACEYLSQNFTGALIVIERETRLGEIVSTGTLLDAAVQKDLICNIFFHNAPLHDGAMIIRDGRIQAAGCFLPLSSNMEIGRELGTRHRAALGMSENSDAVVVVVSEETGAISVAVDSRLQRKLSPQNLRRLLAAKLMPAKQEENEKPKKAPFWRKKS